MKHIRISSKISEPLPIPYRHVTLQDEGFVATSILGNIFLESKIVYDCISLNEHFIQFQDSLEDAVFFTKDLEKLVNQEKLQIDDK